MFRSLLFVPGDRPERFAKAAASGADALILDLEDAVAAANKDRARAAVAEWLAEPPPVPVFVRINPLANHYYNPVIPAKAGTHHDRLEMDPGSRRDDEGGKAEPANINARHSLDADLAAVLNGHAFGIVLPKAEGAASLQALDARLAGTALRILPIATETPRAIFKLGEYGGVSDRLCGLTWGAEDLPAAIGAVGSREAGGRFRPPYETVRALALFAAHAAGVPAIETVFPDLSDDGGCRAYAARGRADGFSGMMALHPKQIAAIHAGFAPNDAEVAAAERIVAAFAAAPGAGALSVDGRMVDAPHLAAAKAVLARR